MRRHVVGLGEILWDVLPDGKKLGGAPANFAYHCRQFGLDGIAVSAVGKDALAKEIFGQLEEKSLPVCLEEVDYPTGVVNVTLDADGVPCYDIVEGVAYDNIHWTEALEDLARNTCAVCFGTLAQRDNTSRNTILLFLDTMPSEGTLKIYDINLRQHYYSKEIVEASLQKSNILKINDEELSVVNAMFEMGDIPAKESCRRLMDRFGLDVLILTCGVNGSYVFAEDTVSFLGTPKVKVADTVGAGDSFTAAMCAGMLAGLPLSEAHKAAVEVSAYVCTCNGAMPILPPQITASLRGSR